MYCDFNYAVNEETLLCRGFYVDFEYGSQYMIGLFQNPWYIYQYPVLNNSAPTT